MAAKLARLVYRMLRYGTYELRHQQLQIKRLKAKAEKLAELSHLGTSDPVKCFGISRGC